MQIIDICRKAFTRQPVEQTEKFKTAAICLDDVIKRASDIILKDAGGIERLLGSKRPWEGKGIVVDIEPLNDAYLAAYIYDGFPENRHDAEKMCVPIRCLRGLELVLKHRTNSYTVPSKFDDKLPRPTTGERPDRAVYGHFYSTTAPDTFLETDIRLDRPMKRSLHLFITMRGARKIILDVEGCQQIFPARIGPEVGEMLSKTRDQLQTFITEALKANPNVPFYVTRRDDLLFYLNKCVGGPSLPGKMAFFPLRRGTEDFGWGEAIITDVFTDQSKGRTRFTFLVS